MTKIEHDNAKFESGPGLCDLSGKVALITGAGNGLGARFAEALSGAGAEIICADLNIESASQLAHTLSSKGRTAHAVNCDVSSSESVDRMVEKLRDQRIDILVNNAGIVTRARRVHEISEQEWDRAIDVNLKGTFLCSKAILPNMLAAGAGSIINIASIFGLRGYFPGFAAVSANYFASKAGIVGFTKQLAVEYARDGIRANVVCPAFHEGTALGMECGILGRWKRRRRWLNRSTGVPRWAERADRKSWMA
jgi:NAD(P)-dependent dehydrogenase (short-subunit alcohol dehydrogenase family)